MIVISGKVVKGERIGERLGYPTANLSRRVLVGKRLGTGVYLGQVRRANRVFQAIIIIGVPGLKIQKIGKVEVYLLGYKGNLYGRKLTVNIYNKLRPLRKYKNERELKVQIKKDIVNTRKFFRR